MKLNIICNSAGEGRARWPHGGIQGPVPGVGYPLPDAVGWLLSLGVAVSSGAGRSRTITGNATAALFVEDAEGRCIFVNLTAEEMTGLSLEELRRKSLHDMIHHHRADERPGGLRAFPERVPDRTGAPRRSPRASASVAK
jgi:PAS domain-containing protein